MRSPDACKSPPSAAVLARKIAWQQILLKGFKPAKSSHVLHSPQLREVPWPVSDNWEKVRAKIRRLSQQRLPQNKSPPPKIDKARLHTLWPMFLEARQRKNRTPAPQSTTHTTSADSSSRCLPGPPDSPGDRGYPRPAGPLTRRQLSLIKPALPVTTKVIPSAPNAPSCSSTLPSISLTKTKPTLTRKSKHPAQKRTKARGKSVRTLRTKRKFLPKPPPKHLADVAWRIEEIVSVRTNNGKREFFTHWCGSNQSSWVHIDDFTPNCQPDLDRLMNSPTHQSELKSTHF